MATFQIHIRRHRCHARGQCGHGRRFRRPEVFGLGQSPQCDKPVGHGYNPFTRRHWRNWRSSNYGGSGLRILRRLPNARPETCGKLLPVRFYHKRTSEFDFSASVDTSLTVKLGDNDLFVKLVRAIGSDSQGDLSQLEAAGLSEDQSKAIQSAIKSAVDRSLGRAAGTRWSRRFRLASEQRIPPPENFV
jgi:hypothetical protein